mmetsp:Transcript_310/g.1248  ORF Transcript_310/g.1248 Transcript_310/m.1248 type:complete len:286 (-) Transcript_310:101-958(-)
MPKSIGERSAGLAVLGGAAAGVAKTVIAPLDRLKLLMQTGEARGVLHGVRSVLAKEGVLSFWKGNFANVVRSVPNKGILLSSYDTFKFLLEEQVGVANASGIAGAAAGATSVILTYPLDLTRTRIAGVFAGKSTTIFGTLSLVFSTQGVRGLYRGITPTLLGSFPYEAVKFSVFDWIIQLEPLPYKDDTKMHASWSLLAGATGATLAHILMYPNETIRRRLQHPDSVYSNPLDCFYRVAKAEGLTGLYRGLGLSLLRGIPNTGLQFAVYETLKKMCDLSASGGAR